MQKPLTYALLLAATLGLAACGDKPEEPAKTPADTTTQPMDDAATEEKAGEAQQNVTEPAQDAGGEPGEPMEEPKQ